MQEIVKTQAKNQNSSSSSVKTADILLPLMLNKSYSYQITDNMDLKLGDIVKVNFANKDVMGVVWDISEKKKNAELKLKPIIEKITEIPSFPSNMIKFINWVSKYSMSPLGMVLKMSFGVMAKAKLVNKKTKKPICENPRYREIKLSDAQNLAVFELTQTTGVNGYQTCLLDGVTGSGKTEVYFKILANIIEQNKDAQILVLLPEIALLQQFVTRFEERFGEKPAVWHSGVTPAKKRDTWLLVAKGKIKVVVGARSALFLPFKNLKLIIVDEEHDKSYKQEEGGCIYHARDMAIVRAKIENFPIILASATPALETMVNARAGKYKHIVLKGRYGGAAMPKISVIDMKKNPPATRSCFLTDKVKEKLVENLKNKEQSLLFLNRRGYAPLTICRNCGHRLECPTCSAWLVKHKKYKQLQCHHCGFGIKTPNICPECEEQDTLAFCGPGVERIEEEVRDFLPDANSLILSSDITNSEKKLKEALDKISNQEIDIIIGTQLIAKGHHFPKLTFVGIVDADLGLESGDLRAAESSYQIIQQVAGRAGREKELGQVYLQSYMPNTPVIKSIIAGNRDEFLQIEINARKMAKMPPFGRLASLIIASPKEKLLDDFCNYLASVAPRYEKTVILGPAIAPMAIIRNNHRRRFLIKTDKNINIQTLILNWLARVKKPSQIKLKIDIDPYSFF